MNEFEKEFVPYEEALALKELGFDEPCFGYHDKEGLQFGVIFWWNRENKNSLFVEAEKTNNPKISAPTYSQAFRWFREKHDLKIYFAYWKGFNIEITEAEDMGAYQYECYVIPPNGMSIMVRGEKGNVYFKNYEEAELACLKKLIEIVKTK